MDRADFEPSGAAGATGEAGRAAGPAIGAGEGLAGGGAMHTAEPSRDPGSMQEPTGMQTQQPEPDPGIEQPEPDDSSDPGIQEPEPDPGAAGQGASGAGGSLPPPPESDCVQATLLWSDGFESGDYRNWSSQSYGAQWGDGCQDNAISTETAVSGTRAQRSEITCPYTADSVHRGYGGVQFDGDRVVPAFTNQGTGVNAPNGIVNTTWIRLDSDTVFENGTWVSFFTVNADCTWTDPNDQVLGFGIEEASGRLAAAHYQSGGGTRTFEPGAPSLPRRQWVRVTTYVNYHTGVMHIWQDGRSHQHVTFSRPLRTMCHFHWGLYASADNDDVVLFEDDNSLWKLGEPWTDFSVEPYFGEQIAVCN